MSAIVLHKRMNPASENFRYNPYYGLRHRLILRVLFTSPEEVKLRKTLKTEVYEGQPDNILEEQLLKLINAFNELPYEEKRNKTGIELNSEIDRLHLYLRTQ